VPDVRRGQAVDVVEDYNDRLGKRGEGLFDLGSASADSLLSALENLGQDLHRAAGPLNPRPDNRQPDDARERLAVLLEVFPHLRQTRTKFQLRREFDEECVYELFGAAEHPGIEVEDSHVRRLEFGSCKVHQRCFSGTPRPKDANYKTSTHI
jgi:hypothetical protein